MAPRKTKSPGKTTRYYRANPEAYKKKLANDTKENKSSKDRKYRRELAIKRREAGLMGKGGKDMCHKKGGKVVLVTPKRIDKMVPVKRHVSGGVRVNAPVAS